MRVVAINVSARKDGNTAILIRHVFAGLEKEAINTELIQLVGHWNVGTGREVGDVEADEEGIRNMQVLGENVAWLLKKIHRV